MTAHHTHSDTHLRLKSFLIKDVKKLIQQEGKLTERGLEFTLKEPALTNAHLKAIINSPHVEVKPIGDQHKNTEMYYDLKSDKQQIRIKVACHKLK